MMPFSIGTRLGRVGIAGPELELLLGQSTGSGHWTPMQKQETKKIDGARPLPLRCLSQFFPVEENINSLGNEVLVHKSAYLSPLGWPGIYSGCHTPIPGPTQLADPNRVRGVRPYTRTLYLFFF